jgi:hypothetical protein
LPESKKEGNIMKYRLITILLVLATICLGPWSAGAAYYAASVDNPYLITNSGSVPQINQYQFTDPGPTYPGYTLHTGSYAGSVLESYTRQQYTPPSNYIGNNGFAAGPATALFSLSDIIISGPAGPVGVKVNLSLNGTLTPTTTNSSGNGYSDAHAWVQIHGGFSSSFDFVGQIDAFSHSQSGTTTNSFSGTGLFSGLTSFSGSESITTPSFTLSNGTHSMVLALSTGTDWDYNIYYPVDASVDANADFFHSLSFATSGDVFTFDQPGYTVNSLDGKIVDNRFVGSPVPVPPSVLLLGSGLLGLAGWRRFRKS